MSSNPVKKKRADLSKFIIESDVQSVSSSARAIEIVKIRERLANKEINFGNVTKDKNYKRINKKFKNMNEDEKKLHIKYLW